MSKKKNPINFNSVLNDLSKQPVQSFDHLSKKSQLILQDAAKKSSKTIEHVGKTSQKAIADVSKVPLDTIDSINADIQKKEKMKRQVNKATVETAKATLETARHTKDIKNALQIAIINQDRHIQLLEEIISQLKAENDLLKNIFISGEDGVAVQKEILKIIQDSGDLSFKDKSADAIVGIVISAIQVYLSAHGFR